MDIREFGFDPAPGGDFSGMAGGVVAGRFQIGALLEACGVPHERVLREMERAARAGSDLIDLGLGEGWIDEARLAS